MYQDYLIPSIYTISLGELTHAQRIIKNDMSIFTFFNNNIKQSTTFDTDAVFEEK
jgi:hypothetical protein